MSRFGGDWGCMRMHSGWGLQGVYKTEGLESYRELGILLESSGLGVVWVLD